MFLSNVIFYFFALFAKISHGDDDDDDDDVTSCRDGSITDT